MGLPALLSFHTVARLGGISAAADQLGMAKSGVSRHVAQLEQHFAVKLLERGARSVKLTPIGIRLDQRIRSILAEVDLLDDIAREESSGVSGQVNLATTPDFGSLVAAKLLPAVKERHPDLALVMRPTYTFEDMQDPGTDLAFRIGTFQDDRLVAKELGSFRCWLVASPRLAAECEVKSSRDLESLPCLTFRDDKPDTTWTLFSPLEVTTIKVSGPFAARSFTVLFDLAVAGHGYAFLPEFMLDDALDCGALVRCLPEHVSRPYTVFLTYRPGVRRIARIDATATLAEELIPELLSNLQG
ncbi:MAG: LysR family transcriptional regulator [Pseudomonadota bacterium]